MTDNRAWRGATHISVYGRRAVREALVAHRECALRVELVRVSSTWQGTDREALRADVIQAGAAYEVASLDEVAALSRDPRNDQGVAARIQLLRVMDADAFASMIKGPRAARPTRILAADGITNPQNIGMMIRAAQGAGFDAILWPRAGCPWVNGLVVKASAGTVLRATIISCETLAQGVAELQAAGFRVTGLDAEAQRSIWDVEPAHRALYVVGSELTGIGAEVRELLDDLVAIPMAAGVESLNAATAAAVLCFAVTRGDVKV